MGEKDSKTNILNNLYTIGKEQKNSIMALSNEILYEVKLYSNMGCFKNMNKDEIVKTITFIKSNKQRYLNISVIDNKKNLVYGYLDDINMFLQDEYVEKVLNGSELKIRTVNLDDNYYADIFTPIKSDKGDTLGLIFFRISVSEINNIIKNARSSDGVESYVVNKEGVFITESRFIPDAIGKQKLNLKKLKLNIDYNKYLEYDDYRPKKVYGRYFPINIDDWVLIIEIDADYNSIKQQKIKLIGQLTVFMQTIVILLFEFIFKKKLDIELDITNAINIYREYESGNIDINTFKDSIKKISDISIKEDKGEK